MEHTTSTFQAQVPCNTNGVFLPPHICTLKHLKLRLVPQRISKSWTIYSDSQVELKTIFITLSANEMDNDSKQWFMTKILACKSSQLKGKSEFYIQKCPAFIQYNSLLKMKYLQLLQVQVANTRLDPLKVRCSNLLMSYYWASKALSESFDQVCLAWCSEKVEWYSALSLSCINISADSCTRVPSKTAIDFEKFTHLHLSTVYY